ncbi:MAG: methyltransferase [Chloroflexi bacterium]|nr:methyltransferase [Chloroflexota bacterium]
MTVGNGRRDHTGNGATAAHLAENRLVRLALDLGAAEIGGPLTPAERHLVEQASSNTAADSAVGAVVDEARASILAGSDPLGRELCRIRPAAARRAAGAFYTPPALVGPMLAWALSHRLDRLIDCGCGSGRFVAGAVRREPELAVVAVDIDPIATILTRANLAALGARRATVTQADYLTLDLPRIAGRTAFVGNPPYVRHHDLSAAAKDWAVATACRLGYTISTLAGLHVYFYLATAAHAQPGDVGCFVTSAEWLDVNYGAVVRDLLLNGLGGQAVHVVDPRAVPFEDAMTTAAIACFQVGGVPGTMRLRLVETTAEQLDLLDPGAGCELGRDTLVRADRWTPLLRGHRSAPDWTSQSPLRAIARVHRGVVTGANDFFILSRERARDLGLEAWCRPAITSAEEILRSGGVVRDGPERLLLLDVPADVDREAYPGLDAYLCDGERSHAGKPAISERYIASHRRPWWHLGLSAPPPIVATYMARQAPAFALNPDGLAVVNIAHGIYPFDDLGPDQLSCLVAALNDLRHTFTGRGRTYHGGLEKFEPREMEALLIPGRRGILTPF